MVRNGACHCGTVKFTADIAEPPRGARCDCSICSTKGAVTVGTPLEGLQILAGEDALTLYQFNTGVAKHTFCSVCGVKAFYRPRSNPDGWSVNARCLDDPGALDIEVSDFDGKNWEAYAASHDISHLSREDA